MRISPNVFSGKSGPATGKTSIQDGMMSDLDTFLKQVPPGERVEVPAATSNALNAMGQAFGNIVAGEVAKFNNQQEIATISA